MSQDDANEAKTSSMTVELEDRVRCLQPRPDANLRNDLVTDEQLLKLIADRIAQYKKFKEAPSLIVRNKITRRKLLKLQRALTKLNAEMRRLDQRTFATLLTPIDGASAGTPSLSTQRMKDIGRWRAMGEFGEWLDLAIRRAPPVNKDRSFLRVWLVQQLGYLYQARTGRPISRTQNGPGPTPSQFLAAIWQAHLPEEELSKTAIDNLIRKVVATSPRARGKRKSGQNSNPVSSR